MNQRQGKSRNTTLLSGQIANAKNLYLAALVALIMVFICTILMIGIIFMAVTSSRDPKTTRLLILFISIVFSSINLFLLVVTLIRRKVYLTFCSVKSGETEAVTITVRRVRMIFYEGGKHEPFIQGVVIKTSDKMTYRYLVPKGHPYPNAYKTVIPNGLLHKTVTLNCYQGTTLLATLPKAD